MFCRKHSHMEREKENVPFLLKWSEHQLLSVKPCEAQAASVFPLGPTSAGAHLRCHSWRKFNKIRKNSQEGVKGTPQWSIFLIYHYINSPPEQADSCSTCHMAPAVNEICTLTVRTGLTAVKAVCEKPMFPSTPGSSELGKPLLPGNNKR